MLTIKKIGEDKELNEITNALPENEEICKDILKMLGNENVNIKTGNFGTQDSLYLIANNSIVISNTKSSCTRVQTVAHECLHSIQDKALLWFNFIGSNIYLLYFIIITALTIFRVIKTPNIFAVILVMMAIILSVVRSYLETDAMTKARYVAKEYMQKKSDLISNENTEKIMENYDILNSIGIKFYNLNVISTFFTKVIFYCIVAIIMNFV